MRRTALVVLALLLLRAPALAAQSAQPAISEKSPTTARVIGIVPGAGHMYAGEPGRGLVYMGGTLGILVIGGLATAADCLNDAAFQNQCNSDRTADLFTVAALGLWGWSIYDAGRAADRTNAHRRLQQTSLIVTPRRWTSARGSARAMSVGMSLRF